MIAVRGRPPKKERLVPIIVMVSPQMKEQMQQEGRAQNKSMSQFVREILERW